ncbi:hypothetical protein GCM10011572_22930 [Pseudoduganella buxea]|uniref:Uncharacterized protein n=1 Tax=Pseudoduganella buxea TaxID=1949069 RepID=A0ABQ1KLC5_9BURK|nr:hypothetical protein GCM10011572_22930 [Pseudoduganella buxea]
MASTTDATFGSIPSTIMMMPPATQTHRLLTPVTATRPTFCEKLVCGKVFRMPPSSVPRPSVRRPAASCFWSSCLPVMSDRARNMPADSIITTTMTTVSVRIITGSNVGMPKANGVTMSNQWALATLAKVILPIA